MRNIEQIKILDKYIKDCELVLSNGNPSDAAKKILFIKNILENQQIFFNTCAEYDHNNEQYIFDSDKNVEHLEKFIDELKFHRAKLSDENNAHNEQNDNISAININNINTANATINQNISIDSTIKAINELPSDILDKKSKEYLENILLAIESLKNTDKEKAKEKIAKVLKYIVDKGVEVGIAILPYLGEIARLLKL